MKTLMYMDPEPLMIIAAIVIAAAVWTVNRVRERL
jgi:hypothetical protein